MTSYSKSTSDTVTGTDVVTRAVSLGRSHLEIAASRRNPAMAPNLLVNGSLENGTASWQTNGTATYWSVTGTDFVDGAHSLLVAPANPSGTGGNGALQAVAAGLAVGQTYTFSAWIKRLTGSAPIQLQVYWCNNNIAANITAQAAAVIQPVTGSWVRYAITSPPMPAGWQGLYVGLIYGSTPAAADSFVADQIQLEAGQLTDYEAMMARDTLSYTYKGAHASSVLLSEDSAFASDTLTRSFVVARRVSDYAASRGSSLPVNMVSNSSFETNTGYPVNDWGTTGSGHYFTASAAAALDGGQSMLLDPTAGGYVGFQQNIETVPGTTYVVSAYFNRVRVNNDSIQAYFHWYDTKAITLAVLPIGGGIAPTAAASIGPPQGVWTRYCWVFTAPPGASALNLSFAYPNNEGSVGADAMYVDCVQMEVGGSPTPYEARQVYETLTYTYKGAHSSAVTVVEKVYGADVLVSHLAGVRRFADFGCSRRDLGVPNLLADTDLENVNGATATGLGGWQNTGTSSAWSISTDDAVSGTHCLKIAPTLANFLGAQQVIDILPNTVYTMSFYARRGSGVGSIQFYSYWADTPLVLYSSQIVPSNIAIGSSWARYSYTFTSPAYATRFQFGFAYPGGSTVGDVLYIDNVQMEARSTASPFDAQHIYDTVVTVSKVGTVYGRPLTEIAASNGYYADDTVVRALGAPRGPSDTLTAASDVLVKKLAFLRAQGDFGVLNMMRNKGFEVATHPDYFISAGNGTLANDTAQAHSGTGSLKYTGGSIAGTVQNYSQFADRGTTYTASVWVYVPSGSGVTKINTGVQWFKGITNYVYIAGADGANITPVYDAWNLITATIAIGSGTNVAAVNTYVILTGLAAGQSVWIDDWTLQPGSSATAGVLDDAVVRVLAAARGATDSVTAADALARILAAHRSGSDSALAVDALTRSARLSPAAFDVTTVSDAVTRAPLFGRTITEAIGLIGEVLGLLYVASRRLKWYDPGDTTWKPGTMKTWNGAYWQAYPMSREIAGVWRVFQVGEPVLPGINNGQVAGGIGDMFADAVAISGEDLDAPYSNELFGTETGEPAPGAGGYLPIHRSSWYTFTPTADGDLFLTTSLVPYDGSGLPGGDADTTIMLYAMAPGGSTFADLSIYNFDDDGSSVGNGRSSLGRSPTAGVFVSGGTQYYVQVGMFAPTQWTDSMRLYWSIP